MLSMSDVACYSVTVCFNKCAQKKPTEVLLQAPSFFRTLTFQIILLSVQNFDTWTQHPSTQLLYMASSAQFLESKPTIYVQHTKSDFDSTQCPVPEEL